jgi:hypothetical protein
MTIRKYFTLGLTVVALGFCAGALRLYSPTSIALS